MTKFPSTNNPLFDLYGICERFRISSDVQNDTEVFSPVSPVLDTDAQKIDWLDKYINAHRIAEENLEFMRKWMLKIPLADLLTALNTNYIGKMDALSHEDNRRDIQEYIEKAIDDDDVCYLIYAYTAPTPFFRQLNIDLAKRGRSPKYFI